MHTLLFFATITVLTGDGTGGPKVANSHAPVFITHDFQTRAECLAAGKFLATAMPAGATTTWTCGGAGSALPAR